MGSYELGVRNQDMTGGAYKFHIHRWMFACTLLHRELRDYSLGQIAFAVFRALFAITQLLCHVSVLLTSVVIIAPAERLPYSGFL